MPPKFFRVLSYFIIGISIISFPWWWSLIILIAAVFYFPRYYEAFFFGFIMDLLYAAPLAKFYGVVFVSFAATIILFYLIEFFKRRLAFYE